MEFCAPFGDIRLAMRFPGSSRTLPPIITILMLLVVPWSRAGLSYLEQIPLGTFEKMREVERYQLKIAEKHYTGENYKVALAEYEKFLTLYGKSPAAPYAQLMWSHTMVRLKKPQTALREGFQSVIDYWPESHEAALAGYCIGDAHRKMGEVKRAQAAFRFVIKEYPDHQLAVRAKVDLLHYARLHQDEQEQLALLNDLTFKVERTEPTKAACLDACHELARHHFFAQRLDEGKEALATTYTGPKLFDTVCEFSTKTIDHLLKQAETKQAALKLGDQLLAGLRAETIKQPDRAREFLYRAAALHGTLGRPSDTWRLYEEIGERFGRDDGLLGKMAEWYKQRDKRDEARRLYGQFKDVVAGKKNIAAMLLEEGRIKEAIEVFRQLLEIDGEHAGEYFYSIAACYEKLSDWKMAIATYRQIDDFPNNYFRMASCHRKMEEYKEAIVLYNQCKVVDKSAPDATLQIGFTYEQAGEREKAIRTFQLTCKRHPKSGEASRAHAHLQNEYNINVTLGGGEDE